ncbi:hypothetical protein MMC17_000317 [Xylographa soralifera]|nr:hypothetical protein [Xylographa soralifera]
MRQKDKQRYKFAIPALSAKEEDQTVHEHAHKDIQLIAIDQLTAFEPAAKAPSSPNPEPGPQKSSLPVEAGIGRVPVDALDGFGVKSRASPSVLLLRKSSLALKVAWKYWYLVLLCGLFWTRSTTGITSDMMSALNLSTSLNLPSGTMVGSLTDFARTLDNGSWLHPIPNLMVNTQLDIMFLTGQIDYVDLVSAEDFRRSCLNYVEVTQTISDNLEILSFLHRSGGKTVVIVTRGVLQWFETIATRHRQRYLPRSLFNYAIEYDETGSSVLKAYNYLFLAIISVLEEILAPLDSLVKDIDMFMGLIRVIKGQIDSDSTKASNEREHRYLKRSILNSLGFSGTRYKRYETQLEVLENITALVTIPQKHVLETRRLLRNAKESFCTMHSTLSINSPTEYFHMISRSGLVDEIKIGSEAIADGLDRIEKEKELYIASTGWVTYDKSNGTPTNILSRGQWKIGGQRLKGQKLTALPW